jgi:hypothetical protein
MRKKNKKPGRTREKRRVSSLYAGTAPICGQKISGKELYRHMTILPITYNQKGR